MGKKQEQPLLQEEYESAFDDAFDEDDEPGDDDALDDDIQDESDTDDRDDADQGEADDDLDDAADDEDDGVEDDANAEQEDDDDDSEDSAEEDADDGDADDEDMSDLEELAKNLESEEDDGQDDGEDPFASFESFINELPETINGPDGKAIDPRQFAKDYPEAAAIALHAARGSREQLEKQTKVIELLQVQMAQTQAALNFDRTVVREVPDFHTVIYKEDFKTWIGKQSKSVQALIESPDPKHAVAVIKKFKTVQASREAAKNRMKSLSKKNRKKASNTTKLSPQEEFDRAWAEGDDE